MKFINVFGYCHLIYLSFNEKIINAKGEGWFFNMRSHALFSFALKEKPEKSILQPAEISQIYF